MENITYVPIIFKAYIPSINAYYILHAKAQCLIRTVIHDTCINNTSTILSQLQTHRHTHKAVFVRLIKNQWNFFSVSTGTVVCDGSRCHRDQPLAYVSRGRLTCWVTRSNHVIWSHAIVTCPITRLRPGTASRAE